MDDPIDRQPRPLRRGDFYAQWRRSDVARAAAAGGALSVAVWAALRARAATLTRLDGTLAPTFDALAQEVGMSRRTLQVQVQRLEEAGLLTVDRRTGRKPAWILLPEAGEGGSSCQGQPAENSDGPWQELPSRVAGAAEQGGSSCTPAPPVEPLEPLELEAVGDDELRKKKLEQEQADELAGLVRRFSTRMHELLRAKPGDPQLDALEELVVDARDPEAWRSLVELADLAAQNLADNRKEADA